MPWYVYSGSGDPTLPGNYNQFIPVGGSAPSCTRGGFLCAVFTEGEDYPITISQNITNYIARGLANFTPQPDAPGSSRLYVRMKPNA